MRHLKFVTLFIVLFVGSVMVCNAQIVKDNRRAISIGTCVDESQLPSDVLEQMRNAKLDEWVDMSSTNGMTAKTVRNTGWATVGVWNERPANGRHGTQYCFTMLDPNATVYVLNGDKDPRVGYLAGCTKNGKPFMNRISVPPPTVITNTVTKVEKVEVPVEVIKEVKVPVEVPGPERVVEKIVEKEICPDCPEDSSLQTFASKKTRFLTGGWLGTAISAGASCAAGGLYYKDMQSCAISAGAATVVNRATQAVNPSPDSVRARCGNELKTFKKGKEGVVGQCELVWEGSTAILKFKGKECKSRDLYRNLNTTVVAVGSRKATAVKTQTTVPVRPTGTVGVGNQIPGGGVQPTYAPGTTVPTRQMRTVTVGGVTKLVPTSTTTTGTTTTGGSTGSTGTTAVPTRP